jgi:hypothetical protein
MRHGSDSEYRAKYHVIRLLSEVATNSLDDVIADLPSARGFALGEKAIVDDQVWSWFARSVCQVAQQRVDGRR